MNAAALARVRELTAAVPPAGLDAAGLALWYAEKLGELRWYAAAMASELDARSGQ